MSILKKRLKKNIQNLRVELEKVNELTEEFNKFTGKLNEVIKEENDRQSTQIKDIKSFQNG
uniref:Uncharacterized protein n=1 Tax=Rhizophagus irregularis (strain DAOM 181602 / DAOM 197198 / MUCL 43194) TaxID=747089 RepID=U9TYC5_RHIID